MFENADTFPFVSSFVKKFTVCKLLYCGFEKNVTAMLFKMQQEFKMFSKADQIFPIIEAYLLLLTEHI